MDTRKTDSVHAPTHEEFHKFVMWGQEQNKKNPWKFGTIEMYSFLTNGIYLLAANERDAWGNLESFMKKISEATGKTHQ